MRHTIRASVGVALMLILAATSASAWCPPRGPGRVPEPFEKDGFYSSTYEAILKAYGVPKGEAHRATGKQSDPDFVFAALYERYLVQAAHLRELKSSGKAAETVAALERDLVRLEARARDAHTKACSEANNVVLEMDGKPKPQPKFGAFAAVEDGKIEAVDPAYKIVAKWDTLPTTLGPRGYSILLTIEATAMSGSVNTGIQIRAAGIEMRKTFGGGVRISDHQFDLPAAAPHGKTVFQQMAIQLMPKATYTTGEKVSISVGTFYGRKVDYEYKAP